MRKVLTYFVFPVIIIGLAYLLFRSINEPVKFQNELKQRSSVAIDQLKDIRTLQVTYKDTYGHYAPVMDSLIDFYNNGKINWNQVCRESIDRGYNVYNPNAGIPYTEICGISLRRLAYLIYGREIDGDKFDYTVQENVPSAVNAQGVPSNYIIRIDKISVNNVQDLCSYYGFSPVGNGWIVNK